jgi:phytanoyl-CoA hydroxylase
MPESGIRLNAVPVTGDLVLIHGSVLHKSERNTSAKTRFAYTFHMIDSPPYAVYDDRNWLQPTKAIPFSRILDTPNVTLRKVGESVRS